MIEVPYIHRIRLYPQFDNSLGEEAGRELATNPARVVSHSWSPHISKVIESNKIRRGADGKVQVLPPKQRLILKAAHSDAAILSHLSDQLSLVYEEEIRTAGLGDVVVAFRPRGKRNFQIANTVFEAITAYRRASVFKTDLSDYFGTIDHVLLKQAIQRLLKVTRLPGPIYTCLKRLTKYSHVDEEQLKELLQIDEREARSRGNRRYCSSRVFREVVVPSGLIKVNRSGRGIPQGGPASAMLSNIYLFEFDRQIHELATALGAIYLRYCDDLILIAPTAEVRIRLQSEMERLLAQMRLTTNPGKTVVTEFEERAGVLTADKPLDYLGFTFDGRHKRIRPASIARFYKKMRRGVGRAKALRYRAYQRTGQWTPLRVKKLYQLYSYVGRRNFLSYAFDAAEVMKDNGIKRQVKRHWKKLQALIHT